MDLYPCPTVVIWRVVLVLRFGFRRLLGGPYTTHRRIARVHCVKQQYLLVGFIIERLLLPIEVLVKIHFDESVSFKGQG